MYVPARFFSTLYAAYFMTKVRKVITFVFVVAICTIVGMLWYSLHHVFPYSIIKPFRVNAELLERKHPGEYKPERFNLPVQTHWFTTRDSLRLQSWMVPHPNAKGTVVVLHGISSCKEQVVYRMYELYEAGFNVVALDLRAHGASEGTYCTLGFYEKYDVQDCISMIERTVPNHGKFALFGTSMGAAIALQTAAIDSRVACVVSEAAFATLRKTTYDYMKWMMNIRVEFLADIVSAKAEKIASFSIDGVSPVQAVATMQQPILFIHGDMDERIPVEDVYTLFGACRSEDKSLHIIPNGMHVNLSEISGKEYTSLMCTWIAHRLTVHAPTTH